MGYSDVPLLGIVASPCVRPANRRQPMRTAHDVEPDSFERWRGIFAEFLSIHKKLNVGNGTRGQIGPSRNGDRIGEPEPPDRLEQSHSDVLNEQIRHPGILRTCVGLMRPNQHSIGPHPRHGKAEKVGACRRGIGEGGQQRAVGAEQIGQSRIHGPLVGKGCAHQNAIAADRSHSVAEPIGIRWGRIGEGGQ